MTRYTVKDVRIRFEHVVKYAAEVGFPNTDRWILQEGSSANGVYFTDGTSAVTQSDASFAHSINNSEFRDVPLKVTYTKAGRISDIEVAK